jgi:enoyl-CoA hydratase/carnithine racemase
MTAETEMNHDRSVLLERRNCVAVATLNRPKVFNALNAAMLAELAAILSELGEDPTVAGLVVTGAGERAFAAGADIAEMGGYSGVQAQAASAFGQTVFSELGKLGKPVIAAVNGFAFGGGCELALACTLRLASPNAQFGQPEVRLGLLPGYGGTQRLTRTVGAGMAAQMILTGAPIDAEQALRIGLVNEIVPADGLIGRAAGLVEEMASNGPLAVRYALEALSAASDAGLQTGLSLENALFGLCAQTDDKREGTTAFLEKRAPAFTGR